MSVPWLRRFVAIFLPWGHEFDLKAVHVGYVVDRVALRQAFV
jgi:hypothetical protein